MRNRPFCKKAAERVGNRKTLHLTEALAVPQIKIWRGLVQCGG
jgi:hypothetical protein